MMKRWNPQGRRRARYYASLKLRQLRRQAYESGEAVEAVIRPGDVTKAGKSETEGMEIR